MSVDARAIQVSGKVLSPPFLVYGNGIKIAPQDGSWNMSNVIVLKPSSPMKCLLLYPSKEIADKGPVIDVDSLVVRMKEAAKKSGIHIEDVMISSYHEDR